MIDFSINEKDQEIFKEIRKQGLAVRNYARYYDDHEEEIPRMSSQSRKILTIFLA